MFGQFLAGSTLEECYGAVASVANRWLDLLDTRGMDLTDEELVDLISESSVMSKSLAEYEGGCHEVHQHGHMIAHRCFAHRPLRSCCSQAASLAPSRPPSV